MSEPAADLSITPLRVGLATLALGLVVALGVAWAQNHFTEWRAVQQRYNALAEAAGKAPIDVRIRQIWKPALGVIDRCTSCHVTMAGAEAIAGDRLFAEHPPIPHEPKEFGCTICHGGEGRATTALAAHGERGDWAEPLRAAPERDAGCGACHTGIRTPSSALLARGEKLSRDYDCKACHMGPRALTDVGLRGIADDWHERHVGRVTDGLGFAPLDDEDVPAVTEYLRSLVGAPRLMAGKRLAAERGCRGCHRIAGVGGDDGPDLSEVGLRVPEPMPPAASRGAAQAAWHKAHLLDPPATVTGSLMPKLGLDEEQAELLSGYVLSLRPRALPEALIPRDRLRTAHLGERDFATDGASLYGAFCSACHGASAQGRETEDVLGPVPTLSNAEFLALADDPFLRQTIAEGRPGRRMQGWAGREGGLRAGEINAVIAFLRSLEPPAPTFAAVTAVAPNLEEGQRLFAGSCAPCHGEAGAGSEIAPPLAAADNVVTTDDNRIYGTLTTGIAGTAMGAFRRLDATALRSVIAAVRALPRLPVSRQEWKVTAGVAARGATLYAEHCVKCHGRSGEGDKGPALANPGFVAASSEGFLAGTIIRGRPGTKMPTFGVTGPENAKLAPAEVNDLVAFLRAKAPVAQKQEPVAEGAGP